MFSPVCPISPMLLLSLRSSIKDKLDVGVITSCTGNVGHGVTGGSEVFASYSTAVAVGVNVVSGVTGGSEVFTRAVLVLSSVSTDVMTGVAVT